MNFENKLEEKILGIISDWKDSDIYAISFLLTTNEMSIYNGISNFPEFSIGYNTEADCGDADLLSEERWNYACWSQNNIAIIDAEHSDMAEKLLQWYDEQGVLDVGCEAEEEMYDKNFNYIGKGPNGYWELLTLISNIARKIQDNGIIRNRFGRIPIIVHDLEYSWYTSMMTKNANPNGEASFFLKYFSSLLD